MSRDIGRGAAAWPMVGRDREVAAFRYGLGGRDGTVVCGGEGVGKTRVAEEFLAVAAASGFRCSKAVTSAGGVDVPLGAVAHLLADGIDPGNPVAVFARAAAALTTADGRRHLVLVDDLHLLDGRSAVLLRQLLDARVIHLLATVRSDLPTTPAADALLHGDGVLRIDLAPLTEAAVVDQLHQVLGGQVGRRTARAFFVRCGGDARYLRELVIGALDSGCLVRGDGLWELTGDRVPLTATLTDLVGRRLSGAGAAGRPVLERLARSAPVPVPMDEDQLAAEAVPGCLSRLERSGLIKVEAAGSRLTVSLGHPLYAEVLRQDLPGGFDGYLSAPPTRDHHSTTATATAAAAATTATTADPALAVAIHARAESGQLAQACQQGAEAFDTCIDTGAATPRLWLAVFLGRAHWMAGHPRSAHRWYTEALALARNPDQLGARRIALSGIAACTAITGDPAGARAALARLRACPTQPSGVLSIGEEHLGDAWFQAAQDRLPQARALLAEAAGQARATGHLAGEALLLTDIARLGDAASVADRLHTITEHCDGDLAPARDRFVRALADSDPQSLLTSAHELRDIGADLLAAEAYTLASVLFRRRSHPRPATFAAALAATAFEACQGARTPLLADAEPASALTDREQEIALLATTGASSRDIAAELFLSVRTVENYLFRTYKKLGISGRRELTKSLIRSPAAYSP